MKKKFCSLILALSMVLSFVPVISVSAATTSGTCGDNLTWTLDDEGTLKISGTGAMNGYTSTGSPFYNKTSIKTIVIERGVTSIGNLAFSSCSNLTSVTIPDSITSIGYRSFYNCSNLTNITLSNSITSIDEGAFYKTGYYNDEANWENDVLYIDKSLIDARNSLSSTYSIKENTYLVGKSGGKGGRQGRIQRDNNKDVLC